MQSAYRTSEALIGAANFSPNGLQLNGAAAKGWTEAALSTPDSTELRNAGAWFAGCWESARAVDDDDLARAAMPWARRSVARLPSQATSLLQLTSDEARDAGARMIVWTDEASAAASAAYERVAGQAAAVREGSSHRALSFYEDWKALPADASTGAAS